MAGFSTAGYGRPLDFSGLAGALQQNRQRQDIARQKRDADRKMEKVRKIMLTNTFPGGTKNRKGIIQQIMSDPDLGYQVAQKMEMNWQQEDKAEAGIVGRGGTQGPAAQVVIGSDGRY